MISSSLVGLAVAFAIVFGAPLLDGVKRKLVAFVQKRVGPPLLQTWYDLAKLFRRSTTWPEKTSILYWAGPLASFLLALTALAMLFSEKLALMLGGPIGFIMLLEASVFAAVAGVVGLSPYTSTGAVRLWLVDAVAEAGILIGFLATQSKFVNMVVGELELWPTLLLAIALLLAGFVELELPPYNVAEAGPEIAAGPYTEYQGPLLALIMWAALLRGLILVYASFYSIARLPPLMALAATVVAYTIYCLVATVFGRPRPLRAAGLATFSLTAGIVAAVLV